MRELYQYHKTLLTTVLNPFMAFNPFTIWYIMVCGLLMSPIRLENALESNKMRHRRSKIAQEPAPSAKASLLKRPLYTLTVLFHQ